MTLMRNTTKLSRDSSICNSIGSMSYLKKTPGIMRSLTSWLCSVTAYWFVNSVSEL